MRLIADGIEAIARMIAVSKQTKVLVLSADPDTEGVRRLAELL